MYSEFVVCLCIIFCFGNIGGLCAYTFFKYCAFAWKYFVICQNISLQVQFLKLLHGSLQQYSVQSTRKDQIKARQASRGRDLLGVSSAAWRMKRFSPTYTKDLRALTIGNPSDFTCWRSCSLNGISVNIDEACRFLLIKVHHLHPRQKASQSTAEWRRTDPTSEIHQIQIQNIHDFYGWCLPAPFWVECYCFVFSYQNRYPFLCVSLQFMFFMISRFSPSHFIQIFPISL